MSIDTQDDPKSFHIFMWCSLVATSIGMCALVLIYTPTVWDHLKALSHAFFGTAIY